MLSSLRRSARERPASGFNCLAAHLRFTFASALALLALFALLRLGLLLFNRELIGSTPLASFVEAFGNGLRFDLRVTVYILLPLLLGVLSMRMMAARGLLRLWLSVCASLTILLGLIELNFYREFHQRLNSLVFQYLQEDPATVLSMLWHGFPVLQLLASWGVASAAMYALFGWLERFHVSPRRELNGAINRLAQDMGGFPHVRTLYRGYAVRGGLIRV